MRRGRQRRYLSREEYREFWAAVTRGGSAPCFYAALSTRPCRGALDADHLLPQRVLAGQYRAGACIVDGGMYLAIQPEPRPDRWVPMEQLNGLTWDGGEHDVRTRSLKDLLMDPRNGVPACRQHHDDKEAGVVWCSWGDRLPPAAREFAFELGLEWWFQKRDQRRERHA